MNAYLNAAHAPWSSGAVQRFTPSLRLHGVPAHVRVEDRRVVEPLRERHNYNAITVPNPYEQEPGPGFYNQGMQQANYTGSYAAMSEDALSREISNIDIGASRHTRSGSVPAPVAYVPVRSHRDRKTFY